MQDDSHSENNVKEAVNSQRDKEMSSEASSVTSGKPPLPPGGCGHTLTPSHPHTLSTGTSPQSSPQVQSRGDQSKNNGRLTSPQESPRISEPPLLYCYDVMMTSPAAKRRPMSGQMMKRVVLWEQQSSTNLNPPAPAGPSPSSSPQHTPQTTPPDQPKRFPFVQRTVTPGKVYTLASHCRLFEFWLPG